MSPIFSCSILLYVQPLGLLHCGFLKNLEVRTTIKKLKVKFVQLRHENLEVKYIK